MVVLKLKIPVITVIFRWLFRIVADGDADYKSVAEIPENLLKKILHKPIIRANFAAPFQRLTAVLFFKRYLSR